MLLIFKNNKNWKGEITKNEIETNEPNCSFSSEYQNQPGKGSAE